MMTAHGVGGATLGRVDNNPLLTPLLSDPSPDAGQPYARDRLMRALAADPALAGRARCDEAGAIVLTGPGGGRPPASLKERQRWELHVRLRLAAELGDAAASAAIIRWECI
jgi:hypothetical protein